MKLHFNRSELNQLIISILLLSFCFSFRWSGEFSVNNWLSAFISSFFILSLIFFIKLIVQKKVAEKFDCEIKYSNWTGGMLLALLTTVGTLGFLIWAAPGAIKIRIKHQFRLGKANNNVHPGPREFAIISLSGILVYFAFALIGKLFFIENSMFFEKLILIGSYLSIFNLIPFVHSPFRSKFQTIPHLEGSWIFFGSRPLWILSSVFILLGIIGFIFLSAWISLLTAFLFSILFFLLWEYRIEPWSYASPTDKWSYKRTKKPFE